jgi:hypothetical protein
MAAGLTIKPMSMEDVVALIDVAAPKPRRQSKYWVRRISTASFR